MKLLVLLLIALFTAGCSSKPPPKDWQMNAHDALERATDAYLSGNARVETAEFARARSEVLRTGRIDLLARTELTRCASRVASLVIEPCSAFEALRADAAAPERAYADYLAAGVVSAADAQLLPEQHRSVTAATVAQIADPLARLVAAGVLFQRGAASPALATLAVEAASAEGWRRPLLAWLGVQAALADKGGGALEAERVRRRIRLVQEQTLPFKAPDNVQVK